MYLIILPLRSAKDFINRGDIKMSHPWYILVKNSNQTTDYHGTGNNQINETINRKPSHLFHIQESGYRIPENPADV